MPKRPNIDALAKEAFERSPDNVHPLRTILADENQPRILVIPVGQLEPNPDQPRKHFDAAALEDLTASVREKGILSPLIARRHPTDSDRCILIAGERRWRAAKAAGLETVPVLLRTPDDAQEIALIENLQRENLSALEEAEALLKLKETKGYTLEDLGRIIGKSKQSVSEMLKILELPEDINAELRASTDVRTFPKSQILQVIRAGSPDKVRAAWNALRTGDATTVRALKDRKETAPALGRPKHHTFIYKPKNGAFRLTIAFSKARVTGAEIKAALREALNNHS